MTELLEADRDDAEAMRFTWFREKTAARSGLRLVLSRDEVVHALADAGEHRAVKDKLPLICAATFRGNHRTNANVEAVHMLGLDIDTPVANPAATVETVATALGGVELFAYSTISSAPGAFKLRALVPYDRPASGEEHRASWALVARVLARAGVTIDGACKDPSRGFYVWAVPPSGAYYHAHLGGHRWPVASAAEVEAERVAEVNTARARAACARRSQRSARGASTLPVLERARRYVERMPAAISGSNGHAAAFAVARRLVADFGSLGLTHDEAWDVLVEYNARCHPPWSERELRHKLVSAQKARVRVDMVTG